MGKTRDLFKKIRDTKGTFHSKMGTVKEETVWTQQKQKMYVQSLGREDSLEKEMATHSSILAREIPWKEEPGGLKHVGVQKSWTQLSD